MRMNNVMQITTTFKESKSRKTVKSSTPITKNILINGFYVI